jgi:predicted nucleic acid-binding protein
VTVVGSLGLVLRAAREGLIPAAAPALQALRGSGIHLDDATIREALARTTGESW